MKSLLRLKIFIIEDVGRRADDLELHAIIASIASGEEIANVHHYFVDAAMVTVVNHLVDAGVSYDVSGIEYLTVIATGRVVSSRWARRLQTKLGDLPCAIQI